ncbi:MAG: alkaline phosphatase [Bacteroidales bacterium]
MIKNSLKLLLLVLFAFTLSTCSQDKNKLPKVNNIILFIGDGMGLADVSAALAVNSGQLHITSGTTVALVKTNSIDDYITDSAAGGTAYSTGKKTKNGYLGVDSSGMALKTILELASDAGYATGLVSTSSITHATPASFIAHQPGRGDNEAIAADFLKTPIDVFIGGGRNYFAKRADGRDLLAELKEKGYQVPDSNQFPSVSSPYKLAWLTAGGHNPSVLKGRGDMLPASTSLALDILGRKADNFFLMVEGSQIDWGGHANDQEYIITELLDFDKAVGAGMKYADEHPGTLIIIVADHETGGVSLTDGNLKEGTVKMSFSTTDHTGIMVPLYAYGSGSEAFRGIMENTDVFDLMLKLLRLEKTK